MPCTTVVGVAEDIVQRENQLGDALRLHYYLPIAQVNPQGGAFVVVRTRVPAPTMIEPVRQALQSVMSGSSYVTVQPLMEGVANARRSWRLGATLFVAFGALALTVAAVGLYGVVSYGVTQRMHELGVRVALGARRADVVRLVVTDAVASAGAGVIVGTAAALVVGRWVQPLLFGESARDPMVFISVASLVGLVSLAASARPALRATRVDPNTVLRAN